MLFCFCFHKVSKARFNIRNISVKVLSVHRLLLVWTVLTDGISLIVCMYLKGNRIVYKWILNISSRFVTGTLVIKLISTNKGIHMLLDSLELE